ncbi:MAG: Rrf2 family transcriptional regulator [Candidatus Aminicenantes bacterium]|nr:Rrf2 family transcriptional regulator [Candidatus Aminicenantes bacterium]
MKLSTKGRYGTRLMVNLARRQRLGSEAVILKSVAEEEGISIRYLEQIIIPLKINKLVKSIRGAGGGYCLGRKAEDIKICDILKALEGTCSLVECVEDDQFCEKTSTCGAYEIWKGATDLLRNYFESVSLEDILEIGNKKTAAAKRKAKPK